MEQNIKTVENSGKLQKNKADGSNVQSNKTAAPSEPSLVLNAKVAHEIASEATILPSRCRSIQTEIKAMIDVGIQCRRDSFDEWELNCNRSESSKEHERALRNEAILRYVNERTKVFRNGMLECRLCGEVANFLLEHLNHIIMHYGPRALCSDCGQMVSHQNLLLKHRYRCPARPYVESRPEIHMQCPHPHCDFMVSSKRQLSRHIGKHLGVNSYYCLQCYKRFSTSTLFLVHRMMFSACCKAKHIYVSKNRPQFRKKPTSTRCTVCLKQFSSVRYCMLHKRRCILDYHKGLRKLLKQYIKKI